MPVVLKIYIHTSKLHNETSLGYECYNADIMYNYGVGLKSLFDPYYGVQSIMEYNYNADIMCNYGVELKFLLWSTIYSYYFLEN